MNRKGFVTILAFLFVAVLAVAAGGAIFYYHSKIAPDNGGDGQVFCTMEAKQCPDGSYVGRSGPKCEFAACPAVTSNWKTYTDTRYGFELKYPQDLAVEFSDMAGYPKDIASMFKIY